MKSDKQICLIIASHPEWLFELSRLPSPGRCKMKSLVLKALQRTADALIVPDDPTQKLSLVEVQFYLDPDIYLRMVEEMAGAQREYERRDIQGILIVAKASYDPQTSPWRDVIKVVVLQDALRELEQHEPLHPLVAVFKPLFETDEAKVEASASTYYRAITQSKLKASVKQTLADVFISWLEQRLRTKGRKEIQKMLIDLPDLEDTQCGKELIQLGVERGELRGEKRGLTRAVFIQLESRFERVPKVLKTSIERLPDPIMPKLIAVLPKLETLPDIKKWIEQNS